MERSKKQKTKNTTNNARTYQKRWLGISISQYSLLNFLNICLIFSKFLLDKLNYFLSIDIRISRHCRLHVWNIGNFWFFEHICYVIILIAERLNRFSSAIKNAHNNYCKVIKFHPVLWSNIYRNPRTKISENIEEISGCHNNIFSEAYLPGHNFFLITYFVKPAFFLRLQTEISIMTIIK